MLIFILQKKVGTLPKDNAQGPFAEDWKRTFGEELKDVEEVDISPALSAAAFSIKGQEELVFIHTRQVRMFDANALLLV